MKLEFRSTIIEIEMKMHFYVFTFCPCFHIESSVKPF